MRRLMSWCVATLAVSAIAQTAGAQTAGAPLIGGLPNVEDMVATADGRWVVASAMKGGGQPQGALYLVDAASRAVVKADLAPAAGTARCRDGFRPERLAPHGLALQPGSDGEILFVVNHGDRESVERFRLTGLAGAPRLQWEDCVPLPPGLAGNGVAAAGGSIFVTGSASAGAPGALLQWSEAAGWRALPGSERKGWNGIVASPDGRRIYAAAWRDRRVFEYVEGAAGPARSVAADFMPDNLHWAPDGSILVAGQDGKPEAVAGCYFSAATACGVPSGLGRLDPATMAWTCTRRLDAAPGFDTATSATAVNGELWLGTTRGQSVMVASDCRPGGK